MGTTHENQVKTKKRVALRNTKNIQNNGNQRKYATWSPKD